MNGPLIFFFFFFFELCFAEVKVNLRLYQLIDNVLLPWLLFDMNLLLCGLLVKFLQQEAKGVCVCGGMCVKITFST